MSNVSGETPLDISEPASDGRLDSWKEIAAYLRRSVRSARRWEKEEGLPIRRHVHARGDSVYAYRPELDAWWENRGANLNDQNGAEEVAPASEEPLPAEAPAIVTASEPDAGLSRPTRKSRPAAFVAVGLFVTLLIAAAWVSQHNSMAAARRPPLPFQSRDWVLVTSFENRTGEPLFDGTVEYALERDLSNSRFVNVVPRERVGDVLRLMRKPPDTRLNAALGREVSVRDGKIRALLTGRIEKLGSKYLLSVELMDPGQGVTVASLIEEAAGQGHVLAAVRSASDRTRQILGEALPLIRRGEERLREVTTPSLKALQLYSKADDLMLQGNRAAAVELLKQAVTEDPQFASAYIHLTWDLFGLRPEEEWRPYAETALRLSELTTEREHYFIRGSYYDLLDHQRNIDKLPDPVLFQKATAGYEALLGLYPDHFWGARNLVSLYRRHGLTSEAVRYGARLADCVQRTSMRISAWLSIWR